MRKTLQFLMVFMFLGNLAFAQVPAEQIDKLMSEKTGFEAKDVVEAINGTRAGDYEGLSYGAESVFNGKSSETSAATLDATHFVVAYKDHSISNTWWPARACVGTVSGTSITWGTPVLLNSTENARAYNVDVVALDASHFVVAFTDGLSPNHGKTVAATVSSGDVITAGTTYVFNDATTWSLSSSALDASTFVISFKDGSNSDYGTSRIGTVTGNAIAFGSKYVFASSIAQDIHSTSLSASQFVVSYRDYPNDDYGAAQVGTIAAGIITFGTKTIFNAQTTYDPSITSMDASTVIIAFVDVQPSYERQGGAIIGNVSGNTISFATKQTFRTENLVEPIIKALDASRFVIAVRRQANPYGGTALVGYTDGTTLKFGPETFFNGIGNDAYHPGLAVLNSTQVAITYRDQSDSDKGTAVIGTAATVDDIPVLLATTDATTITASTAASGGHVLWGGASAVTARGVCWSTSMDPTIADMHSTDGTGAGSFESSVIGLQASTLYYVRAYAINSYGTGYGDPISFTTKTNLATISTEDVTSITGSSASSGGEIAWEGSSPVYARGVCWSTSPMPTIADYRTTDGQGGGSFISALTSLSCGTIHYVRAYATNSKGTSYGNELTFATPAPGIVWDGPTMVFTKTNNADWTLEANQDRLTDNVWITRKNNQGLFNIKTSSGWDDDIEPYDTEWAYGTTADYASLSYKAWVEWHDWNPPSSVGQNAVLHLISENIYIDIKFTSWTSGGSGGGFAYERSTPVPKAAVSTTTVNSITETTASGGGEVLNDAGIPIIARGVCWNTAGDPTTADSHTTDGSGLGVFTSAITGLTAATNYHVRAYATDANGTVYACPSVFTTSGPLANKWDGLGDEKWDNGDNWSSGFVPTEFDDVVIADGIIAPVISATTMATCKDLTVNAGAKLVIEGDFNGNSGSLINKGSLSNAGTIEVQQFINEDRWYLFAAPNNNTTASMFQTNYMQDWNEITAQWSDITEPTTPLMPVKGYGLWVNDGGAAVRSLEGTPNTGNQSMAVTVTANMSDYEGSNLLGNPYPSSIDWSELDDTWGAVYYWDGSGYVSWNNNLGDGSEYIPPMQGFFIVAPAAGTFELTNDNRAHYNKELYKAIASNTLVLETTSQDYSDKLFINLNQSSSTDFDVKHDAYKFQSGTEGLSELYSFAGEDILSIDVRPEFEVLQLGFYNNKDGVYNIGISDVADLSGAILEDTKTEFFHNLFDGAYEFVWNTSDDEKRFKLHMNAVGIEESIANQSNALIYASGQEIIIKGAEKGSIRIANMMGRVVMEEAVSGSEQTINTNLTSGIYMVTLVSGNSIQTEKVFIK